MERSSAGPTAFVLAALLVATTGAAAQSTASARKAAEIADLALTALGGRDAWEGTRYIRFTFLRGETALKLTWDKWSGRSRLDATAEDGRPYVVLMNVNTKQGHAYLAGGLSRARSSTSISTERSGSGRARPTGSWRRTSSGIPT